MRVPFWPALLLLAACGGPEANLKSQDPYERFLGERELVEQNDPATMTEIVNLLEDPHFLVVVGALELLAHQGRPEFLQHFVPKLKHKHPLVRQAACAGLATIRNRDCVPPLVEVMKDPDPAVRRSVVKALGTYLNSPEARTAVLDALNDKDPSVSYMAHRIFREKSGRTDVPQTREAWAEAVK
jgi:HEAT repeat protein